MRISFVMLNNHDIISLIENRLDSVSAEYQSVDNKIEIYGLDGDLMILEINQNMFSIFDFHVFAANQLKQALHKQIITNMLKIPDHYLYHSCKIHELI